MKYQTTVYLQYDTILIFKFRLHFKFLTGSTFYDYNLN